MTRSTLDELTDATATHHDDATVTSLQWSFQHQDQQVIHLMAGNNVDKVMSGITDDEQQNILGKHDID